MARVDAHELQYEVAVLEQRDALEHILSEDPVRIVLFVDQMTDPAKLGASCEPIEACARALGVREVDPGGDSADPRVGVRLLEHRVGVGVGACGLDEDRAVDPAGIEQRTEVVRLERSRDGSVRGTHPGHRLALEIPEVLVAVDDHRWCRSGGVGGSEPPARGGAGGSWCVIRRGMTPVRCV